MVRRGHMRLVPAWRLTIRLMLAVVATLAIASAAAGPAAAAPEDEPAIDQYADPFGPLGTGKPTPASNLFTEDFAASVPAALRRRLERTDDGATLELLLAQVSRARSGTRRDQRDAAPIVRQPSAGGNASGTLASAASAVFDGDSDGALLAAGLILIAAGATALRLIRRPDARSGQHRSDR